MKRTIQEIIQESISYELDVYDLYLSFSEYIPEDEKFWKQLAEEELNHASILRKCLSLNSENQNALENFSSVDIKAVFNCRKNLKLLQSEFEKNPTSIMALQVALKTEKSTIESNYQVLMNKTTDNKVLKIFQLLCGEEKNHLKRIINKSKD